MSHALDGNTRCPRLYRELSTGWNSILCHIVVTCGIHLNAGLAHAPAGVTPRRWLNFCNPELSALITEKLGSDSWCVWCMLPPAWRHIWTAFLECCFT